MGVLNYFDYSLRGLLVVATLLSFIPQLRQIVYRGNSTGISLFYILLINISAIEQFTIFSQVLIFHQEYGIPDRTMLDAPTIGVWLNWAQFVVVLLCSLTLFALCLYYPPPRCGEKGAVIAAFLGFSFITLAVLILELTPGFQDDYQHGAYGKWFPALFLGFHAFYVNLPVTLGILVALIFQFAETSSRSSPGALSTTGLAAQAVVFMGVGISWIYRIRSERTSPVIWYTTIGWAAVNNILLAIVQGVLYYFATRLTPSIDEEITDIPEDTSPVVDEESPLLAN